MEQQSFIFMILFMTLGPIKIIPVFAQLTKNYDIKFKREVALKAALIATGMTICVALAGPNLLANFNIKLNGLRIAGGLVLLISALNSIFAPSPPPNYPPSNATAIQLAIFLATPVIVAPVGVAAILIFVMIATTRPDMDAAITQSLLTIMVLDFLVMFFIDYILKIPGLIQILQIVGSVLVFLQVALAIDTILLSFTSLGLFKGVTR